jgi:hypothetical protein
LLDWDWIRELVWPHAGGGPGAPTIAKVTPDTAIKVAAGCNANACFVCELRAVIAQALKRDPRLAADLEREEEAREKKKKLDAKAAKEGSPSPAPKEQPEASKPLDLTILGLRRLNSVSDEFDDRMVVFCRLPNGVEATAISDAVGPSLLSALEKAAGEAKDDVRVVSCSGSPWLAALFTITTDAGLQRRKTDVQASLENTKKEVDSNQKKLDDARQRKKQIDDTELKQAKKKLEQAKNDLQSAQKETKGAKDKLDNELKSSKKDRAEVQKLRDELKAKRRVEAEKTNAVKELTRAEGKLVQEGAQLERRVPILEKAGQDLDQQKAAREKQLADSTATLDQTMVRVAEGTEGWTAEGRAMMLPGYYPQTYSYFVHHCGGDSFASDTSLTALTVGYIPGLRLYSGRHIRKDVKTFLGKDLRVGELKTSSGARKFLTEDARLTLTKNATTITVSVHLSTGESITVQDNDIVLVHDSVGGTNIHRAHNTQLAADGTLQGAPMTKVQDWSWGCQTFPESKEFNLFIRLCAVAKRWDCASSYHVTAGPDCAVLEAGSGDALGAGEQAMLTCFGKELFENSGDVNRAKHDQGIQAKQDRIAELTWTPVNQRDWDALNLKTPLSPTEALRLEDLHEKRSRTLTEVEQQKLDGLLKDRETWRRDYLREKTKRLAADHLRICDVRGKCKARFSYTLLEMTAEEMQRVGAAFLDPLNKQWNGKLV